MKLSPIVLLFAVVLLLLTSAAGGCGGGGERTFTPEEFAESINAQGAGLSLGPVLTTSPDGTDVHTVELVDSATGSQPAEGGAFGGSGTLVALPDADSAAAELDRCEATVSLVCFRAANVVLRFEDLPPAGQARITSAVQALATE